MQRFTVFSILLSLSVVLIITDTVFHGYLNELDAPQSEVPSSGEETVPDTTPEEEAAVELTQEDPVEIAPILEPTLTRDLFESSGFTQAVLKENIFSGLIFQLISFSDQSEASIYQWNLFDGEEYIGSIYEIHYPTETGSFQGYLALRERAAELSDVGTVNEVNNYGDASFYFNHSIKVNTVHLIMRTGTSIYVFEYNQSAHEKMKKVFDSLNPIL